VVRTDRGLDAPPSSVAVVVHDHHRAGEADRLHPPQVGEHSLGGVVAIDDDDRVLPVRGLLPDARVGRQALDQPNLIGAEPAGEQVVQGDPGGDRPPRKGWEFAPRAQIMIVRPLPSTSWTQRPRDDLGQ